MGGTKTLTARQEAAWPEAIARLIECGAEGIAPDIRSWSVQWHEESRPGRGHFINATYIDGEIFAQVLMDVYGYPNVPFAELHWIHADSNEECTCPRCQREQAEHEDAT